MKTRYYLIIIIMLGIGITGSVVLFAVFFESVFEKEHYKIEITGMKDVYLVGEQYDFSYVLSGYGQSCGSKTVHLPDEDGKHIRTFYSASCAADTPMKNFVFDLQKEQGTTYGHVGMKDPGWYNVIVELNYEDVQKSHEFFVVENNCDELIHDKSKAQCLAKSYESCTSAYMTQQFTSEEDDSGEISLVATVQSWNDCQLTIYTLNSLDGHTPFNGIRSICNGVTVNEDSLNFENCDNADYPPILLSASQESKSSQSNTQESFQGTGSEGTFVYVNFVSPPNDSGIILPLTANLEEEFGPIISKNQLPESSFEIASIVSPQYIMTDDLHSLDLVGYSQKSKDTPAVAYYDATVIDAREKTWYGFLVDKGVMIISQKLSYPETTYRFLANHEDQESIISVNGHAAQLISTENSMPAVLYVYPGDDRQISVWAYVSDEDIKKIGKKLYIAVQGNLPIDLDQYREGIGK